MKCSILTCWVILILADPAVAQVRTIRVTAGNDIAQAYSSNGFYRFPQFVRATLYYKGGRQNKGPQFNYNFLSSTLQFIGPKGDTLELAGSDGLDSVVFEKNTFFINDGFMEMFAAADSILLLKKTTIKSEVENIGAYGMPTPTGSITNLKSYSNGVGVYNLILNQDVVLTETTSWFFSDKKGSFMKANKINLLKLLSADKQTQVENYLRQNKTSFDKETDLKKLMIAIAG